MYRGHNVVTEQGRKAVDEFEHSVDEMQQPIMHLMQENPEGFRIAELFTQFPLAATEHVREAMWRLFDHNILRLTVDRRIVLDFEKKDRSWY